MDAKTIITYLTKLEPAEDSAMFDKVYPNSRISAEQGDEIARRFEGDYELFVELDEKPGRYVEPYYRGLEEGEYTYEDWHYKLRQARNSAPHFFEILAGEDPHPTQPIPKLLSYTGNGNPLVVQVFIKGSGWRNVERKVPASYPYLRKLSEKQYVSAIGVEVEPGSGRVADFRVSELTQIGLRAAGEQIQAERTATEHNDPLRGGSHWERGIGNYGG